MMKRNPMARGLVFVLCAVTAATGFWASYVTLRYWDDLWRGSGYYTSGEYWDSWGDMETRIQELARLETRKQSIGLTYTEQERLDSLKSSLAPENTNYRYELRLEQTGELVSSNLGGALLEDQAEHIQMGVYTFYNGEEYRYKDELEWKQHLVPVDKETVEMELLDVEVLRVWTGEEYLEFRADEGPLGHYNRYGWYSDGDEWVDYNYGEDSRVTAVEYALRGGLTPKLEADDEFLAGYINYVRWQNQLPLVGIVALVSAAVCLVTLLYLCRTAGHREDTEEIVLGWPERIPLDVYAVAAALVLTMGLYLGDSIAIGLNSQLRTYRVVGLLAVTAVVAAAGLGLLLSLIVRIKARKVLDGLLIWRLCKWCWQLLCRVGRALAGAVKSVGRMLSMNARLGIAFLVYLAINAFLAAGFYCTAYSGGFFFIGLVLFNGGVFWLACRWIEQWQRIRVGTGRVLEGNTAVQIDTKKMYPDLKQHAEQLNDLGASINRAVDERLKSEHFKAELITNVSHDLKTPLTSIINYVDLLKKTDIRGPKALEYLEVLDRKSQRLKKLTEDLVEASKASTGNVTVNAARLDLVEFTQQAAAEYQDRLLQQNLTLIMKMADHPVYISADGRHLWRILDNLLGNCVKYALEGTRVYLDVVEWDGKGCISVKNISRDELNVSPEELTERFVRGDESRTTEGSGLGLSIARSLTEVQGGSFRITTDGDLFKAAVYFPVVLTLEESNLGEKSPSPEAPGAFRGEK